MWFSAHSRECCRATAQDMAVVLLQLPHGSKDLDKK
jgi:hypothetical protein